MSGTHSSGHTAMTGPPAMAGNHTPTVETSPPSSEGAETSATRLVPTTASEGTCRVLAAIPAFNEELAISGVVLRARRHVDEVLVIDDGSSDRTPEVAELAGAAVLRNGSNRGKGYSVRAAFQYALDEGFGALVLLDGDGQHEPDEIPNLLHPILHRDEDAQVDVSLGFRFGENTEMPGWRRVGKRLLDYATAAFGGGEVTDSQCGYRAFGAKAIERMAAGLEGNGFSVESEQLLLTKDADLTLENVPITCRYDGIDGSTKNPVEHAAGVLMDLAGQTVRRRPILCLGVPGVALLVLAAVLGVTAFQSHAVTGTAVSPVTVGATVAFAFLGLFSAVSALTFSAVASVETRVVEKTASTRQTPSGT